MSDSPEALRRKYGKYLPHQRANVDQVPLPFVNDMDSTYDMRVSPPREPALLGRVR